MKLVIGGYAQGKLNYVLQGEKLLPDADGLRGHVIFDGRLPEEDELREAVSRGDRIILYHFHEWIKTCMRNQKEPEAEMAAFLTKSPDCIIISDEIGNGIVPVDAFERAYRERTGRLLISLAASADEVVRVICGIGQKIK